MLAMLYRTLRRSAPVRLCAVAAADPAVAAPVEGERTVVARQVVVVIFCCRTAGQGLAQKECLFHRHW